MIYNFEDREDHVNVAFMFKERIEALSKLALKIDSEINEYLKENSLDDDIKESLVQLQDAAQYINDDAIFGVESACVATLTEEWLDDYSEESYPGHQMDDREHAKSEIESLMGHLHY